MSCSKKESLTLGPIPAWTVKSTTNWNFFALSPPMSSSGVINVRVSFEMANNSGDCKIRPVLRMSNDGVTWDSPVAIGTATLSDDGTTYGAVFENMATTTTAKQLVQFGIEVQNATGSGVELCLVSMRIDIE